MWYRVRDEVLPFTAQPHFARSPLGLKTTLTSVPPNTSTRSQISLHLVFCIANEFSDVLLDISLSEAYPHCAARLHKETLKAVLVHLAPGLVFVLPVHLCKNSCKMEGTQLYPFYSFCRCFCF